MHFMSDRFTTDPADEMLILTTQKGKPVGTATRKECHTGLGRTHWGFLALIKRSNETIVVAKRSRQKSVFANIWDASVASHVLSGDTPESAAQRETREELGMHVSFTKIGDFFYTTRDGDYAENEYCTFLIGRSDQSATPLETEVSAVKHIPYQELYRQVKALPRTFSPWLKIALERYGSITDSF